MLIKTGIVIFKALSTIHFGVIVSILISVLTLIIDLIGTLLLPVFINWLIEIIRILLKKEARAYLPPTNSFFEDIDQWELLAFDFDGKLINSGSILQGTEERQTEFLLLMRPKMPKVIVNYYDFLENYLEMAKEGSVVIRELTDYSNKIHFVKVKEV